MKIKLSQINPQAILLGIVSVVLVVGAIAVAFQMNNQTEAVDAARAVTLTQIAETERWQKRAPTLVRDIKQASIALAPICRNASNTNALMLRIVDLVNDPGNHVTATADDLIATYPSPTPMPAATQTAQPLGSTPQNATPSALATPMNTVGAGNHAGSFDSGLVAFKRTITIIGQYPEVIESIKRLNNIGVPIVLSPPSVDRLGDTRVSVKAPITIYLPPPDTCQLALAPKESNIIAPGPTPAPTPIPGVRL